MSGHPYWATLAVAFVVFSMLAWAFDRAASEPGRELPLRALVFAGTFMAGVVMLITVAARAIAGVP